MRILVFFDLPMLTKADHRQYVKFRKYLIKQGFVMMQKSVYSKLVLNGSGAKSMMEHVRKHSPSDGVVQMLVITETQFQNIEYIIGAGQREIIDTQDRLVII